MTNQFDMTTLVEEVPGVPVNERWYLRHQRKTVWKGATESDGRYYASSHGLKIEAVEYFEP